MARAKAAAQDAGHVYLLTSCEFWPIASYTTLKKAQQAETDEHGVRRHWSPVKQGSVEYWESQDYPGRAVFRLALDPQEEAHDG